MNLFEPLLHHHKIITLRNNFLLDAVQPKVNGGLADFEKLKDAAAAPMLSSSSSHPLLSCSYSACKSSRGKGSGNAWQELLSSVTPLTVPQGAVSVSLMGEAAIYCLIKP